MDTIKSFKEFELRREALHKKYEEDYKKVLKELEAEVDDLQKNCKHTTIESKYMWIDGNWNVCSVCGKCID